MAQINLGRVAYVNKGIYGENVVYEKYDVVLYNNGSYVYWNDTKTSGHLPTDTNYFKVMLDPTLLNLATDNANTAASTANTAAANADTARANLDTSIATTEASSTASSAHAVGSYLYLDGTIYKVTAPIAIGDTIAVGTNIATVPGGLSSEVSDLKSALHDELYSTAVSDIAAFTVVQGERVKESDGSFEENASWERTNYIDVDGYIGLSVGTEYTLWNCALYKSDYSMLSFMSITPTTGTILLPTNAKYLVMSVSSPRLTGVIVRLVRHSYNSAIDAKLAELAYKAEYTVVPAQYTFVQGALSSSDGSLDTSSARRISSTFVPIATAKMPVHIDVKYQSNVFFYSAEAGGYKSNIGFRDGDYVIGEDVQIPADAKLIRISLRNKANPNTDISPSDIQTGEVTIQYISPKVDETDLAKYNNLFVPPALPNIMWVCRDSRVRNDVPPNSPQAIKLTAYNQYDRVRFSVTKTADVTPTYVAVHDTTINGLAVNPDGTPISGTVNTADCTLDQLNAYDWGLKFGAQYAGMHVPMLDNCLKLASIYGLRVALDIKWTVDDTDIDNLTAMLAKYGQTDAIFFAVNPVNAAKFKAKNKRFSYLYAGTYEQMQTQEANLVGLLTGYNHIYLANRPLGTAPTMDIINFACVNNFDIMYSPIEGMNELTTLGFDKGITLMECHYIENIKKSVMDYADSLID